MSLNCGVWQFLSNSTMKAWSKYLLSWIRFRSAVSWRCWDFWHVFLCVLVLLRIKKGRTKHFGRKKHCFSSLKRALTSLFKGLYAQRELTLIYHQSAFKDSQVQWISSLSTWWILKTLNKTRQTGLSFLENTPFPPFIRPLTITEEKAEMKACTLTKPLSAGVRLSFSSCTVHKEKPLEARGLQGKALTGSF